MLSTYWDMGHDIVEYEQDGKAHAIYGSELMKRLSKDLTLRRGKDELMVKYATYGMDPNLFVSKYELYLPNENALRKLIEDTLSEDDSNVD